MYVAAFLNEADDDMWGKLMVAALRTTEAGQRREATYLGLLSNCSEDEIDAIQKFFIDNCALLKPLPNANQYRVLVAAGNDLGMVLSLPLIFGIIDYLVN